MCKTHSAHAGYGDDTDNYALDFVLWSFGMSNELKRMIQRIEWWPEYSIDKFYSYVVENGIDTNEIIRSTKSYAMNQAYVLNRIKGGTKVSYFGQRDLSGIESELANWTAGEVLKICFIVCSNDQDQFHEMKLWIERLWRPSFVSVEILKVENALSICSGYNEGMRSSDAKIKIYMHQDVRILNPFFINDVIRIFIDNSDVGMIGMVGTESIPKSGVMWQAERVGAVLESYTDEMSIEKTIVEINKNEEDHFVTMIDGFMMITGVDLNWNEEKIRGWDFYDASHSLDYLLKGYKIVVPKQKIPWCLHDFGKVTLDRYEENRIAFIEAYRDIFEI